MLSKKCRICIYLTILSVILLGCLERIKVQTTLEDPTPYGNPNSNTLIDDKIGFEIIEFRSRNSLRAWICNDINRKEFSTLKLPLGWIKNQPREVTADGGRFYRSPSTENNGEFLITNAFGFNWWHSATVIETNIALDEEKLLNVAKVHKYHELRFDAGRTLTILVSPSGECYILISRDTDRTQELPTIPKGWELKEYNTLEELVIMLPEKVLVIRTDNNDSFQGPVKELRGVYKIE